jgi:uncharacterized membrane-anchored protein
MKHKIVLLICTICFPFFLSAESDTSKVEMDSTALAAAMARVDSTIKALDYKSGKIVLKDNLATITVPEGFAFLESKDAKYILEKIWGNPADNDVLGLLVPKNVNLLEGNSWAVIYTYDDEGHIDDGDAEDYDYTKMLADMKEETEKASVERIKMNYEAIELIGWAKTPFYDKISHKLHWAKELKFGKDSLNMLNYNIRMLGRKGVLVMNIVSGIDNMKTVEVNINPILASTNFNTGNRYEDFDSGTDKVAEYGIGGLIAGGILVKTGLLAKLGLILVKAWKLIAVGFVGLVAGIKKFFGRKKVE